MDEKKTLGPLDSLPPEIRARLDRLQSEILLDKLTTSFAIEERSAGGKRSTFYCVTGSSRGHGGEINTLTQNAPSSGFTPDDAKIVRCLISKHVVGSTYDDAAKRGVLPKKQAMEEAKGILHAYDETIARLLTHGNGK